MNTEPRTIEHEFPLQDDDQYAKVAIRLYQYGDGSTLRSVVLSVMGNVADQYEYIDRLTLDPDRARELARLLTVAADEAERVDKQNNDLVKMLLNDR
jgi:hypothetical protein